MGGPEQDKSFLALGTLGLEAEFYGWFKLPGSCAVGEQGAVVHPSAAEWVFAVVMQLLLSFTLFCYAFFGSIFFSTHLLITVCLLLLILVVSSHLITSANSTVCWVHPLSGECQQNPFTLSATVSPGISLVCWENCCQNLQEWCWHWGWQQNSVTWMPQEHSLDSSVAQPRCGFCAFLVFSIPICASNS